MRVGDVVWFYPEEGQCIETQGKEPLAAIVAATEDAPTVNLVNLAAFDAAGRLHSLRNVQSIGPEDAVPSTAYCVPIPPALNPVETASIASRLSAVKREPG